jgi:hypothetical protein
MRDEALKQAIKTLNFVLNSCDTDYVEDKEIKNMVEPVIAQCEAALAQPAQEPFGHWHWEQPMTKPLQGWFVKGPSDGKLNGVPGVPLFTFPPKREWVGLTPEDTEGFTSQEKTLAKYVNKVLQEKNTCT